MDKTKVFISCGQRENTREIRISKRIVKELKAFGYKTFLAKSVQSLSDLVGFIYRELETSEYFLFVDFKREGVIPKNKKENNFIRGSLFSHQELAIASYLKKECLVFREKRVKIEGVQTFIISNPNEFSDEKGLIKKIKKEVKNNWEKGWKDQLEITVADPVYQDAIMTRMNNKKVRWFHLTVKNNHLTKHAKDCFAYLIDVGCGPEHQKELRNSEIYWAGYEERSMTILPGDIRDLDLFFFSFDDVEKKLCFHTFATSSYYGARPITPVMGSSTRHKFTIRVVSDNFSPAEASFVVSYNGDINRLTVHPVK